MVSLFTNIPIKVMIEEINQNWDQIKECTNIKSKATYKYIEGIKLCSAIGYFSFNSEYYKQLIGTPLSTV